MIDEATSSLDPATEARIMTPLAARARAGTTVVAVTHHLDNVYVAIEDMPPGFWSAR